MEEIQMWLPFRIRYAIRLLAFLGAVVAFGIVSYASILTLMQNLNNRTATLSMPFYIFIFPTVLGFILLTMEYAILFFGFLKKPDIQEKKEAP
jgi:TRAP-type C4-dicarboxylate transport system permease small subunit